MSDLIRAALRQALATGGTALVVGALHVPQPFLGVLAAQLVGTVPCKSANDFLARIAAAWAGIFAGLVILVLAPDQQWIALPAFCLATGLGIPLVYRRLGTAPATLFAMGIGAMFATGFIDPASGIVAGFYHGVSLTVASAATVAAWFLCMPRDDSAPLPAVTPHWNPWLIGLASTCSLVIACLAAPTEVTVMTIATMVTVIAMETLPGVTNRFLGAGLGVVGSFVFLIIVSGAGNNVAVFLGAMALVTGGCEWASVRFPRHAIMIRQAAAMFVVAATIFPQPLASLESSIQRIIAVVLGCAIACAFEIAPRPLRQPVNA